MEVESGLGCMGSAKLIDTTGKDSLMAAKSREAIGTRTEMFFTICERRQPFDRRQLGQRRCVVCRQQSSGQQQ
ncbi:MAG: hypothetical protein A3I29_03905 [Candidatus Magasanikbacteria bacterium RIFCSPLOWO2_02_FULL_44_11]|uniref:Uncharacterized protein n=1 Tax=Candidatus Magasanikbacteria bacterium RIFCSPLOWO2_02_FULL_44_11 TaxID=1798689 RepID=A0A1F6NA12_9BACT|nr:MAG: hypothetical protein A3I29_03905 [Candidatus Magasanikbacteria bacterium RIFCSPLOWO2_02_FULL_44_11]